MKRLYGTGDERWQSDIVLQLVTGRRRRRRRQGLFS